MHAEHRQRIQDIEFAKIRATRLAMASWLSGSGVEIGAGARPFDVPPDLNVMYGDVRNGDALRAYFGGLDVLGGDRWIDAQTFSGVPDESFDFVITAHVLEHLLDPVGSIGHAMRVIRPGGVYLLTVPDMRFTFDRARPETTLEHVLRDYADGGARTLAQAHEEHIRFVHTLDAAPFPEEQIPLHVAHNMSAGMDIHVHAWTATGFAELLKACEGLFPMRVEASCSVANENIYAIRKI